MRLPTAWPASVVLADQWRLDEAESFARQARSIYQSRLGTGHLFTVAAGANVASILVRQQRYDEAAAPYRDGLEPLPVAKL